MSCPACKMEYSFFFNTQFHKGDCPEAQKLGKMPEQPKPPKEQLTCDECGCDIDTHQYGLNICDDCVTEQLDR